MHAILGYIVVEIIAVAAGIKLADGVDSATALLKAKRAVAAARRAWKDLEPADRLKKL
jgi:hypothetical protein